MTYKQIAAKIKDEMKGTNTTYEEMALRTESSADHIHRALNINQDAKVSSVIKMLDALGLELTIRVKYG